MTYEEFDAWLTLHIGGFAGIRSHLKLDGQDGRISRSLWYDALKGCQLEHAKTVTRRMVKGTTDLPRGWSGHPAAVRREAELLESLAASGPVSYRQKRVGDEDRKECPDCEDTGIRVIVHPNVMAAARNRELDDNLPITTCGVACVCRHGDGKVVRWQTKLGRTLPRFNPETMIRDTLPDHEIRQQLSELAGGVVTVPMAEGTGREWVYDPNNDGNV